MSLPAPVRQAVEDALSARFAGRVHIAAEVHNFWQTAGQPEGLRAALPVVRVPVEEHWQQVRDAVAQLELPAPRGVDGDVEALARLLAEAGDCLALSNGDPSVVNCKIFTDRDPYPLPPTAIGSHSRSVHRITRQSGYRPPP